MKWETKVKFHLVLITVVYFINLLSSVSLMASFLFTIFLTSSPLSSMFSTAVVFLFICVFAAIVLISLYCYYLIKKFTENYIDAILKNEELVEQKEFWRDHSVKLVNENKNLSNEIEDFLIYQSHQHDKKKT